jgi:hypothetical protein
MRKVILCVMSMSLFCLIMISCEKGKTDVVKSDAELLQDFFNRNMVPSQMFTIDAGTGGVINTAEGTRITFPPNALLTASGQLVTGNVAVEFKEINRKADFFLSNKPTVANNAPLESGGTWKLNISKDGAVLRINPAVGIRMNIKRDNNQQGAMQLFSATPKDGDGNIINWGIPLEQRIVIPVDTPFRSYSFKLEFLGWGNADVFMSNPVELPNIRVKSKNGEPLNNFSAIFIYKNRKTAWALRQRIGNEFIDNRIAKDQPGHFILAGYLGGVFTTGILKDQTLTTGNQTIEITLTTTYTEADFKALLNSFL